MKIHTSKYRTTRLFSAIALALLTTQTMYATTQTGNTSSENTKSTSETISHDDPYILTVVGDNGEITGNVTYTEGNAKPHEGDTAVNLDNHYLVGAGVTGTGIENLLEDGNSITVTNIVGNSGTIGVGLGGANVESIGGTITVAGTTEAVGLGFSGVGFSPTGAESTIGTYTGTINVTGGAGTSKGIDAEKGSLGSIAGANINVSSDKAGNVIGINVGEGATVGKSGGIQANISTTTSGGASFINAVDPSSLGVISGNFTMITDNSHTTDPWILGSTFSAGYVVGYDKSSTSSSVGFSTSRPNPLVGGTPENISDSFGFLIDWEKTSMTIHRNYGLAAGAAVFDRTGKDFTAEMTELFKQTTFGSGSKFDISVTSGMAAGAWINGLDVSQGALLGTINATADTGAAVGIFTTGTDLLDDPLVTQSLMDTKLGLISGNITATVKSVALNNKAIGLQLGNKAHDKDYVTSVNELSGNITAVMHGATDKVLVGKAFEYGSGALDTNTIVAGIVDTGTQTLNFNADATPENGDAAGTSVRALVYAADGTTLVGYGQAIATLTGGISVNSIGTSNNAITFVGDLTAGIAGDQTITFQSGRYNVTSEMWNANAGITFGTKADTAGGLHDVARVTLSDIAETVGDTTTLHASTLNFTANNNDSASQLLVAAGHDLNLSGLTEVNIYLTGTEESYDGPLYFVDARQAINFELDIEGIIDYNIYFLDKYGNDVLYKQHDSFKIVHDDTGIYLHIPEPSTATLSLFALVGLLARRRRRA